MGNILFGVDIAKLIAEGFAAEGGLRPATLVQKVTGTATVGALTAGTNDTDRSIQGDGFVETVTRRRGETLAKGTTAIVSLIGDSFLPAVPQKDDEVTIDGTTYKLLRVKTDPAAALYECQAQG